MKRTIEPELLDDLPSTDARAIRSRKDLRQLNGFMRHASMFRKAFASKNKQPPQYIIEICAGDGTMMLKLAEQTHTYWPRVHVTLVDRQRVIADKTLFRFHELGWQVEVITADVFYWLPKAHRADMICANLFLHHFSDEQLTKIFSLLAARTDLVVACETRRDWASLTVTRAFGLLGFSPVTQHDALASARAGFIGDELSTLWPNDGAWELTERRAGIFTHLFIAQRKI